MATNEDEYFAREELHRKQKEDIARTKEEREALRKLHYMKCPKCGADLATKLHESVEVDVCKECGGVWLDAGELEMLAGKESVVLKTFFGFFKHES